MKPPFENLDVLAAWLCAQSCLLYERDPWTREWTRDWREFYASVLFKKFEGDLDRLAVVDPKCRQNLSATPVERRESKTWECAIDLCERAREGP